MVDDDNAGNDWFGLDAAVSWLSFLDASDARKWNAGRVALLLGFYLVANLARSNAVLALMAASVASGELVDRAELARRLGQLNEFHAQHTQGLRRMFDAIEKLDGGVR